MNNYCKYARFFVQLQMRKNGSCAIIIYSVNRKENASVIHKALSPEQGLIEVENGVTAAGRRNIYIIVKTHLQPSGMQYCLTLHIDYSVCAVEIHGFFDERGMTGERDSMVFAYMRNEGKIQLGENGITGWSEDPYDPNFNHGILMNLSEDAAFDSMFPEYPLSVARRLVTELITKN